MQQTEFEHDEITCRETMTQWMLWKLAARQESWEQCTRQVPALASAISLLLPSGSTHAKSFVLLRPGLVLATGQAFGGPCHD